MVDRPATSPSGPAADHPRRQDAVYPEIRVLIVEDHELVAHSLVFVLQDGGMEATAVTGPDSDTILDAAWSFQPTVVLLDRNLGPSIGSAVPLIGPLRELGAEVVILTGITDRHLLAECLEGGAVGIIQKSAPLEDVVAAIVAAARHERVMEVNEHDQLLADLRRLRIEQRARLTQFEHLTPREQSVLIALGAGKTATEIADDDFVSVFTIRGHIRSILAKLEVGSQIAAVGKAREAGWL